MLLNNTSVQKEIPREIKRYFELTQNENVTYENSWDAAKAVLVGKFTALKACIGKEKKNNYKSIIYVFTLGNWKNKSQLNPE